MIRFQKNWMAGGLAMLMLAALLVAWNVSHKEPPKAPSPMATNTVARSKKVRPPLDALPLAAAPAPPADKRVKAAKPAPNVLESKEAAIEQLQEVATTYDPAGLPKIRGYLANSDPELRAAAVNAMIVIGDASAGPMLREAARKLASVEEAKTMEEAANYVELPSADLKELLKSKTTTDQ